jgi:translocation protein SEC63
LTQHPDKVRIDPEKNLTAESINEHWVEITKAFKTLTDEEIRNNYLQYGHPDGKQSFSMGIALPTFLVADGYGKYTLVFYLSLLGVILPYFAGKWWYGTQKRTRDGILVNSAANLVREYREDMTEGDVITAVSAGDEYQIVFDETDAHTSSAGIESKILAKGALSQYAGGLTASDKTKLLDMQDEHRRKVLALLWAYLGRVEIADEAMNKKKFAVAPHAWKLGSALSVIALPFQSSKALVSALHASQNIIQAVPPGGSPLLQLPYFNEKVIQAIEGTAKDHMTVSEWMAMPADKRKKVVVGPGLLTEQQYQTAVTTALQFPAIHIDRAYFRVQGEKFITPNSLVQLIVKFRFVPPGAKDKDIPAADEKDLKEVFDDDDRVERERFAPPLTYAPYYARDHSAMWQLFLGDSKMGRIAVPPFAYSTFDKLVVKSDGEPTYNVQTLKMQFGAPPTPGNYTFVMHLINDSYLGFDIKMPITLTVEDPSKAENIEDDGEISEPDEGK